MANISVIIPAKNEALNLGALVEGIYEAFAPGEIPEVIVVDDASTDDTAAVVGAMTEIWPTLRLLQHSVSAGQSAAVSNGVRAATSPIVCTTDGDGQNPPSELPGLVAPLLGADTGRVALVAGQRVKRQDTLSKRLASKFANGVRGWLLKDGTRDTGCGLKAFRRDLFLELPYFNHMHRYLPALFKRLGYEIALVDVSHQQRGGGSSNYSNLQRGLVGIVDLFGVMWLIRRRKTAEATEPGKPQDDA